MSTWNGISHGRMTRSMSGLRPAEYKVLATIRRLIPDGERRKLSHADIAAKAGVSEGTVSKVVRALDGVYLHRHFLGRGRGRGYAIEVIPPPEVQRARPLDAPAKGSPRDPSVESFASGAPTPQTAPEKGSSGDPSLFLDHAHEQQQQRVAPEHDRPAADPEPDRLAPETVAALAAAGAHPKLIKRVEQANPTLRPGQVAAALAIAEERALLGAVHTPPGLAFDVLAIGQMPAPPRSRPTSADPPPPTKPAQPAPPGPRRAGRAVPPGPDEPEIAQRWAAVARLTGSDARGGPRNTLVYRALAEGATEAEAAAELAAYDAEERRRLHAPVPARAGPPAPQLVRVEPTMPRRLPREAR